jgi:hypothetical protein
MDMLSNQALKNIGIMMILYNRFHSSTPISSQLKVSDFSGVTNEHGSISFRIPSNRAYVVYLYNVVTNASYNYNANVYVEKDATIDYGMTIY